MTSGDINGVIAVSNSIFVSALPACKPIQKTGKLRSEVGDACEISQEEGIWSVFKINHFSEKNLNDKKIYICIYLFFFLWCGLVPVHDLYVEDP